MYLRVSNPKIDVIFWKYFFPTGGGYEYSMPPPPPPMYHQSKPRDHHTAEDEYVVERESHGLGLADLFDVSLTGIAFLSFGMFVLQVLMCITTVSSSSNLLMKRR